LLAIEAAVSKEEHPVEWRKKGRENRVSVLPHHIIMSLWLSSRTLMAPSLPPWLEDICHRLERNDETFTLLELTHTHRVDDVQARVVANALRDNTTIESMVLSCFAIVDDGAFALGTAIAASPCLRALQFRELRTSREVITLFRLLRTNSSIRELSLRHCQICQLGGEAVEDFLREHSGLAEVRFVDCQFVGDALERVCRGLAQTSSPVQRLSFVNTEIGSARVENVRHVLQNAASLRELYLGENDLGDEGVAVLTAGVLQSTSLRLLDLRANGITPIGAMSLQGVVTRSRHVVTLSLSANELGNTGAAALARGLSHRPCTLQTLDVSDNGIDDAGAGAFAHMLRFNTSLQELNLSFNPIGDDGARRIALSLQKNRHLRCLSLRRSGLTNAGAQNFAESIPKMTGLKELTLNKNGIDTVGLVALLEALRRNVDLEYLHVAEQLSEPVLQQIVHWIRLNKAGRRIFRHTNASGHVWPLVYARVAEDSDILFHFLRHKPDAVVSA
jgi:Ran GTPase-activating protein (RanGAP) involved in mRNA processing and transport